MSYPPKFQKIIDKIRSIEKYNGYEAAFLFGSLVRGDYTEDSDIDVKVITKEDKPFKILHPKINNIKLDLTYLSYKQLEEATQKEIKKAERPPFLLESIILFDKKGRVKKLKENAIKAKPLKFTKDVEADYRFLIYHANDKVKRSLKSDKNISLLAMHIGIKDLLKAYYVFKERWWLSDKKLIKDLKALDASLHKLLMNFLNSYSLDEKYIAWSKIYDYILQELGGFRPLEDEDSSEFQDDLNNLLQ